MKQTGNISRRGFLSTSIKTAGAAAAGSVVSALSPGTVLGANDRITLAVIGIQNRGRSISKLLLQIPGVQVKTLCDIDENLYAERVSEVEKAQGKKPTTEFDLRRVYDDKDIDAVIISTTDHWHALAAIWACQAGKHVYLEKPITHNIWEGRKIIEAARKYNRIVTSGLQARSIWATRKAMKFLHEGGIGDVYMAKGLCFKPRDSIGKLPDTPAPESVHYDLWLGPAPLRPFNPNRFHYNWHWFWDYGCADIGNQGAHQMDILMWGLNKRVHPKKIRCVGGYYAFDSDQETPNTQLATFEYDDGAIIQFEARGLYTNSEDDIRIGCLFFGTKGWMHLNGYGSVWKTYLGRNNEPGPSSDDLTAESDKTVGPDYLITAGESGHYLNFIHTLRSGNAVNLSTNIEEGHMSASLCHLANISYRLGRELTFDSFSETFTGDDVANRYLTRNYRYPYVVPEMV